MDLEGPHAGVGRMKTGFGPDASPLEVSSYAFTYDTAVRSSCGLLRAARSLLTSSCVTGVGPVQRSLNPSFNSRAAGAYTGFKSASQAQTCSMACTKARQFHVSFNHTLQEQVTGALRSVW